MDELEITDVLEFVDLRWQGVRRCPWGLVCEPAVGEDLVDRVPSDDDRAARILPIGCTGWLIDDAANCFLAAGHCAGGMDVCQFNVPLLSAGGALQHPGPEDQYSVDDTSIQSVAGGIGNDWGYFGCFDNTETGLSAGEAQGVTYMLAAAAPPVVAGQNIRITGYGVDSSPSQWNQIHQTHSGTYALLNGNQIGYVTDTEGGNSGSAAVDGSTGLAIGIHTNGGCSGGFNSGTAIHRRRPWRVRSVSLG